MLVFLFCVICLCLCLCLSSEFRVQSPHSHSRRKNISKSNIGQIDCFDKDIDDFDNEGLRD